MDYITFPQNILIALPTALRQPEDKLFANNATLSLDLRPPPILECSHTLNFGATVQYQILTSYKPEGIKGFLEQRREPEGSYLGTCFFVSTLTAKDKGRTDCSV